MQWIESIGVLLGLGTLGLVVSNITFPSHANLKKTKNADSAKVVKRINEQILRNLRRRLATLRVLALALCGLILIGLNFLSGADMDFGSVLGSSAERPLVWTSVVVIVLTVFSFFSPAHRRLTSVHNYFGYGRSSKRIHNVMGKAVSAQGELIPTLRGSQSEGLKSAVLNIAAAKHTDDRQGLVDALLKADYDASRFARGGLGAMVRSVLGVIGVTFVYVGIAGLH